MWLSPHDEETRLGQALLGPHDVDNALARVVETEHRDVVVLAVLDEGVDLPLGRGIAYPEGTPVVGMPWSTVATVRSGRLTVRPD